MLSGSASALTRYTGFAVILFSGIAVAALFVLRRREPGAPRPFRAIGYPVAPAVFLTAEPGDCRERRLSRSRHRPCAASAAIAVGIPLYWWLTHRRRVS